MERTEKSSDELFTRGEVLGGLPAKRAATLVFLIESRTAHLADQSRRAMEFFLTEEATIERDLAFLEAFALGREPPLRPTIQDIERYAPQWASLVPDNPQIRAALTHLLGQKYKFTYESVPEIRASLGLDEESVARAYSRLYRKPLEKLFASRTPLVEKLLWSWTVVTTWQERLPPFWTTFVLTVALPLPTAILALPIAVAHIGPLSGILLLVVIGLINVLTMACMAEACVRSGAMRYGKAFVGRLVTDFLGHAGSSLLSLALGVRNFLTLLASSFGMAVTMVAFTRVPSEVWIALLFLIDVYLLSRKTLKLTVTVMVLLAGINIALFLPIALLGFSHARPENLLSGIVPFLGEKPFDPLALRLVFGVVLSLYFGHTYVLHCAKVVLPRDLSGRSLIRGSMAGTIFLTGLLAIWVLAIGGAVAPQALASQAGTALAPLAEQAGPVVNVLGSGLIIFFLGMSCIRTANILFNLVHERLPTRLRSVVILPRRRGSLLLSERGKPSGNSSFGLTYLGLTDGEPQFGLDIQWNSKAHHMEVTVPGDWDATALLNRLPDLPRGIDLTLEILEASPEGVRLRVTSPMSLTYEGDWDIAGLSIVDALVLPDSLRHLVNWMTRREQASLAEVIAYTGQNESITRTMLETLVGQGFVQAMEAKGGKPRYRIRLASRRGRQVSQEIWRALDSEVDAPASTNRISRRTRADVVTRWVRERILGERGRFILSLSPVVVALLLAEWLLVTGLGSFTWLISFTGMITLTLASGIFPTLLLISSRQKGDLVPGVVYRVLGHPLVVAAIYVFFLANLFLHGLVIWQNPLARASAVCVGLLIVGVTLVMVRRGAFTPRVVVELREDQREGGRGAFAITAGGKPASVDVRLGYAEGERHCEAASGEVPMLSGLRSATFHLPPTSARELKVWAHRVTPDGNSEGLPALVEVHCGENTKRFDLKLSGGQAVLPLTGDASWLRITLPESPS